MDAKINTIAVEAATKKQAQQEHEKILQANLKEVYDKAKDKGLGNILGPGGPRHRAINPAIFSSDARDYSMDVDDPVEGGKGKNKKYVFSDPRTCINRHSPQINHCFFFRQIILRRDEAPTEAQQDLSHYLGHFSGNF